MQGSHIIVNFVNEFIIRRMWNELGWSESRKGMLGFERGRDVIFMHAYAFEYARICTGISLLLCHSVITTSLDILDVLKNFYLIKKGLFFMLSLPHHLSNTSPILLKVKGHIEKNTETNCNKCSCFCCNIFMIEGFYL